jgi:hypothetical protein
MHSKFFAAKYYEKGPAAAAGKRHILSFLDPLLTKLRINNNSFARAFELHTVLYTVLYPYFIYPVTNIMLSASIFLTVVLGLER